MLLQACALQMEVQVWRQPLSTLTHVNPTELWEHGRLFEGPAFFFFFFNEIKTHGKSDQLDLARPSNKVQTATLTVGGVREGCEEVTATGWDGRAPRLIPSDHRTQMRRFLPFSTRVRF